MKCMGFFCWMKFDPSILKHVDVNAENTLSYELLKASPLHTASGFSNSSLLNLKIQLVHL